MHLPPFVFGLSSQREKPGWSDILHLDLRKDAMPRKSPKEVTIDANLRCLRIYPTEATRKTTPQLKTVGFKLSRDQAVAMARVLLAVTQEWKTIDVTAYRFDKRHSDGTYHITVTSFEG